jgi:type II secretory pathway component HofQ
MTTFVLLHSVDSFGTPTQLIQKIEDDGTIWAVPTDPANSDYQEYLKSLEGVN